MLKLKDLEEAAEYVAKKCKRTPTLKNVQQFFDALPSCESTKLHLKLENMQISGSFKMRGVEHQLHKIQPTLKPGQRLVTFSGGNYGKAFAMVTNAMKIPSLVVMSNSVPQNRVALIRSFGAEVELVDAADLLSTVQRRGREDNAVYVDPFDDYRLISAYGSVGFEILEDVPDVDTVLIPCGGGGLVSGAAAGLRERGCTNARIYAVEPETANTMHESFLLGHAAKVPTARSVASGLCPPYAGELTYATCKKYVDDVLLVNDEEIVAAVKALFKLGFIVEPSGAAGLAALLSNKVPTSDIEGKNVLVVISGGNVTLDNLRDLVENKVCE